jgi:hypothetical protein
VPAIKRTAPNPSWGAIAFVAVCVQSATASEFHELSLITRIFSPWLR